MPPLSSKSNLLVIGISCVFWKTNLRSAVSKRSESDQFFERERPCIVELEFELARDQISELERGPVASCCPAEYHPATVSALRAPSSG